MTSLQRWLRALGRPAVFAHRGASRRGPENSLLALRLAADAGADGVEFDVQRCASGELVVFHDRTLSRCTGAIGAIDETPLSKLKALTLDRIARLRSLTATGERIPTLAEWLESVPPGMFLNLEVKADTAALAEIAPDCVRALVDASLQRRAVVSSFNPLAVAECRGAVPRAALVESGGGWRRRLAWGLAAGGQAVNPESSLVTAQRVRFWHRLGYPVMPWTVDDEDEARRCLDAGVDALITNHPDRIRPIVETYPVP